MRKATSVRYDSMVKEYESRFGHKPTYIARAPGRVKCVPSFQFESNIALTRHAPSLIGEHIDYVLFGCFPAAIERDILIACGPSQSASGTSTPSSHPPGGVKAENLDPKYKPQHFIPKFNSALGPSAAEEADAASNVHAETSWHLDIDKRELRWESYVKAVYYVIVASNPGFI